MVVPGDVPPRVALDRVSFDVNENEFLGILGPNGAGKTTCLKIIAGLLAFDAGNVTVAGIDARSFPDRVKRFINLVTGHEDFWIEYTLTVRENLEYWAVLNRYPKRVWEPRIQAALELVELAGRDDAYPRELSSGMRQRLILAKGLVTDAPIYLLDEPTIGLDPLVAHTIRKYLKEKVNQEWGRTLLLTTHSMSEAEYLCDRIVFLREGRVAAIGTPREFKNLIADRTVVDIETCSVEALRRELDGKEYVLDIALKQASTLRIDLAKSNGLPALIRDLSSVAGDIQSLTVREPSLEDVYRRLMEREPNA